MPRFIKPTVATLALFFMAFAVTAKPTNDAIFGKAVDGYDKVIKLYEKFLGKEKESKNEKAELDDRITPEQYVLLKRQIEEANELFEQFLRVGTDDAQKKAARLYSLTLKKIDIACLNDLFKYSEVYPMIKNLDAELNIVKGYYYPIKYKLRGKNYIINFSSLNSLDKQLMVQFTEASAFTAKYSDAFKYSKKAYSFYSYGDYNLWWTTQIWYYSANKLNNSDADIVMAAEKVIYAMSGLKRKEIKMIKDSNWVNYTTAYYKLNTLLTKKPELSRNGEVWAKAGESFEKLDEDKWALEYYNKALKAGYGDKIFLLKMMEKGKDKKNTDLVKSAVEIFESKNLYSTWDCLDYSKLADYYEYIGNTSKADELRKKNKDCVKTQNKEARRRARGGKFYVSFAPLALLSQNLQGSVQIGGNRRLHEFGIKQTNSQRDYGWDIAGIKDRPKEFRWSGNSFYYTYKRFSRNISDRGFYTGFQFRYTQRVYDDVTARVKNNTTSATTSLLFQPKETRYDFTLQMGTIVTSRLFHLEYYMGVGAGYSTFDGGRNEWNNENYTITNQEILNGRKESRVGLTLRMGLMIGLNFINKGY